MSFTRISRRYTLAASFPARSAVCFELVTLTASFPRFISRRARIGDAFALFAMPARIARYVSARIVRFAHSAAVRMSIIVRASAIFAERTVDTFAFDALLCFRACDALARLLALAPVCCRNVTIGTSASAFAVVNLIAGAPTSALAVRFLAVIGTAAVVPRRTVLTRHVTTFFTVRT